MRLILESAKRHFFFVIKVKRKMKIKFISFCGYLVFSEFNNGPFQEPCFKSLDTLYKSDPCVRDSSMNYNMVWLR